MRGGDFSELTIFAAVARHRSFRRAAAELNLRPSTLSHAVKALEQRLGVTLLARTTRSVAPSQAGASLLERIQAPLAALDMAIETINPYRSHPRGALRLTLPQNAAAEVMAPRLADFLRACPDVELELSVWDGFVDIVEDGFDAGIRLGESVGPGMTSIRVSAPISGAVVATPAYWREYGRPRVPADLTRHRCINRRHGRGRGLYRWRFKKDDEAVEIACRGPLILDAEWLILDAARAGVGVAQLSANQVAEDLAAGRLEQALQDWSPPLFAYHLYHPSHPLPSASLAALIQALRL